MKKLLLLTLSIPICAGGFGGSFNSQGFGPDTNDQFTISQSQKPQNQTPLNSWLANQEEIQKYVDLFTQGNQSVHSAYLAMTQYFKSFQAAIENYNWYINTYLDSHKNPPVGTPNIIDLANAVTTAKNKYLASQAALEKALSTLAHTNIVTAIKNGTFKNVMYLRMLISEYFFARAAIAISPFRTILSEGTITAKSDYPVWQGFSSSDTQIFKSIVSHAQAFAQMCKYMQTILVSPQEASSNQAQNSNSFNQQQTNTQSNNPLSNPLNTFAGVIIQTPQLPKMPSSFFYNTTINASFVTNQQDLPITQACNNTSSPLTQSSFFTFKNDTAWDQPTNPTFVGGQITICSNQQTQISAPVTFQVTSQVVAGTTQITALAGTGIGTTATQATVDILSNQALNNQVINFFTNAPNNPWVIIFEMGFSVDNTNNLIGLTLTPKALAQLNPLIASPKFTQWQSSIPSTSSAQETKTTTPILTYSTTSYNGSYPLVFLPSYFYSLANPRIKDSMYDLPPAYRFTAGITNGYLQSSTAQQWPTLKGAMQSKNGFDYPTTNPVTPNIDNTLFYALKSSYFALKLLYLGNQSFAYLNQIIANSTQDIPDIYIGATQNYQPILPLPITPTANGQNQTTQATNTTQSTSNQYSTNTTYQPPYTNNQSAPTNTNQSTSTNQLTPPTNQTYSASNQDTTTMNQTNVTPNQTNQTNTNNQNSNNSYSGYNQQNTGF